MSDKLPFLQKRVAPLFELRFEEERFAALPTIVEQVAEGVRPHFTGARTSKVACRITSNKS